MRYVWETKIQSFLWMTQLWCYRNACGIVRHNLIFCHKVMTLKKSVSTPTSGNMNKNKMIKRKTEVLGLFVILIRNSRQNPKRLIWSQKTSCMIVTLTSTCQEWPLKLLTLPRTLTSSKTSTEPGWNLSLKLGFLCGAVQFKIYTQFKLLILIHVIKIESSHKDFTLLPRMP